MTPCLDNDKYNEKWEITSANQIRQIELDMCLDSENLNSQDHVFARKCDPTSQTQKWKIGQ